MQDSPVNSETEIGNPFNKKSENIENNPNPGKDASVNNSPSFSELPEGIRDMEVEKIMHNLLKQNDLSANPINSRPIESISNSINNKDKKPILVSIWRSISNFIRSIIPR